jgi:hypothetical protein
MAEARRRRSATTVADAAALEPDAGLVRLHHEDAAGCSHAGIAYAADRHGDVLVPATAVGELRSHGFLPPPARSKRG